MKDTSQYENQNHLIGCCHRNGAQKFSLILSFSPFWVWNLTIGLKIKKKETARLNVIESRSLCSTELTGENIQ